MQTLITITIALVGGGAGTALVNGYLNRDKTKAQVHNMNIEGDLKIGDNWKEYATQLRKDLDGVKQELTLLHNKYLDLETKYNSGERKYNELEAKYNRLNDEHTKVLEEREIDKEKIAELQKRVAELQEELTKYKKDNE